MKSPKSKPKPKPRKKPAATPRPRPKTARRSSPKPKKKAAPRAEKPVAKPKRRQTPKPASPAAAPAGKPEKKRKTAREYLADFRDFLEATKPPEVRKLTQERGVSKKAAFLSVFAETGNVTKSAAAVGISRDLHYRWLKEDVDYAAAFAAAELVVTELLEEEAIRRAYNGTEKPVFFQGVPCGFVQEYSDGLLMFLLQARNPKKYRQNAKVEHVGLNDGPIQLDDTSAKLAEMLTPDELAKLRTRLLSQSGADQRSNSLPAA